MVSGIESNSDLSRAVGLILRVREDECPKIRGVCQSENKRTFVVSWIVTTEIVTSTESASSRFRDHSGLRFSESMLLGITASTSQLEVLDECWRLDIDKHTRSPRTYHGSRDVGGC